MKYTKIQTLFKRNTNNKNVIVEGDYSKEEFPNIKNYLFTEKIDGTNIRVSYDFESKVLRFDGKTDNAQIPAKLYAALQNMFTDHMFEVIFAPPPNTEKSYPKKVILYGEGYGAGIQNGGLYRDDNSFILFDVLVDEWWLQRKDIEHIGKEMNIDVVPILGIGPMEIGIDLVKKKTPSLVSKKPRIFEGVVATSHPLMLFRDGEPIKFKLKVKDYEQLERMNKNP